MTDKKGLRWLLIHDQQAFRAKLSSRDIKNEHTRKQRSLRIINGICKSFVNEIKRDQKVILFELETSAAIYPNQYEPYPVTPHPPTGFVPAPAQPATYGSTLAGAAPYGVFPNQPQLYAAQGPPPPTYDQTLTHPMMYQPMYGQGYPGYLAGYPAYGPLQYYPPLAAAAAYYPAAAMQPPVRPPTLVMPNGFDATNRFDSISQPVLPPPPTVPNAAQLAAMASHSVAISQKKNFLGGGTEGGYTF